MQVDVPAEQERSKLEGQKVVVIDEAAGEYENCVVTSVAVSSDGKWFATAGAGGHVALWDAATGTHVRALQGHTGNVVCVAWRHDGSMLATCSLDGTARVWDVATGAVKQVLQ